MIRRGVSLFLCFVIGISGPLPSSVAQDVFFPQATEMVALSPSYTPCMLLGMKVLSDDPFLFNFIVDEGDADLDDPKFRNEIEKLVKYFLASMTTPQTDLWVNLSPHESDRIIADDFGRTTMGRDLLAQDYLLKQMTSSLMYPEEGPGELFWKEVYQRAYDLYGTTDVPIETFNKVWIVPETVDVYEALSDDGKTMSVLLNGARLKVMLDTDYLAREKQEEQEGLSEYPVDEIASSVAQEVMRKVLLPLIEKEVNEGTNFAPLRRIYHSLLLAVWFKKKLSVAAQIDKIDLSNNSALLLSEMFVDRKRTAGMETADPQQAISTIYDRYVEAFEKGVYDLIKEDRELYSDELIPHKYFSGGFTFANADQAMKRRDTGFWKGLLTGKNDLKRARIVKVQIDPIRANGTRADRRRVQASKGRTKLFRVTRDTIALVALTFFGVSVFNWLSSPEGVDFTSNKVFSYLDQSGGSISRDQEIEDLTTLDDDLIIEQALNAIKLREKKSAHLEIAKAEALDTVMTEQVFRSVLERANAQRKRLNHATISFEKALGKAGLTIPVLSKTLRESYDKTRYLKSFLDYPEFVSILIAIMDQETDFNKSAINKSTKAIGLLQVLPSLLLDKYSKKDPRRKKLENAITSLVNAQDLETARTMINDREPLSKVKELFDPKVNIEESVVSLEKQWRYAMVLKLTKFGKTSRLDTLERVLNNKLIKRDKDLGYNKIVVTDQMRKHFLTSTGRLNNEAKALFFVMGHYSGLNRPIPFFLNVAKNTAKVLESQAKDPNITAPKNYQMTLYLTEVISKAGMKFDRSIGKLVMDDADRFSELSVLTTTLPKTPDVSRVVVKDKDDKTLLNEVVFYEADDAQTVENVGGIDLSTEELSALFDQSSASFPLNIPLEELRQLSADVIGFDQDIVSIQRLHDPVSFLGLE